MLGYVIGDSDMVTGFKLVGIDGIEVDSVNETVRALDQALSRKDLSIIILSEEFSTDPHLQASIEKVRGQRKETLIVELPGSKGKPAEVKMSDLISKILGVRI
jgi:vacuolar-type H+-ATPase subunit F/Vma7